jgi:hypothetical protein
MPPTGPSARRQVSPLLIVTPPNCKILLVEASTNYLSDLSVAEGYATGHANVVSNSYGAKEFSGETSYDGAYNHPGVPISVSSGRARIRHTASPPHPSNGVTHEARSVKTGRAQVHARVVESTGVGRRRCGREGSPHARASPPPPV